jgi:hypothetical protein
MDAEVVLDPPMLQILKWWQAWHLQAPDVCAGGGRVNVLAHPNTCPEGGQGFLLDRAHTSLLTHEL